MVKNGGCWGDVVKIMLKEDSRIMSPIIACRDHPSLLQCITYDPGYRTHILVCFGFVLPEITLLSTDDKIQM